MPDAPIVLLKNSSAAMDRWEALRWAGGKQVVGSEGSLLPVDKTSLLGCSKDPGNAVSRGETDLPGAATCTDGWVALRVMDVTGRSAAAASWETCAP